MNEAIEKFGNLVGEQSAEHPGRAAGMLGIAYRLVGAQAAHFPSKKRTSSREYLQGYLAAQMADMLKDPSGSAVVNIFMPAEIFHAMGIPIMAPEALATYVACTAAEQAFLDRSEEEGASETLCSYHRCLLGMAETGVMKKPLLVANTTLACDANQLTFRHLAEIWNVPHVVIDVPYDVNEGSVSYVAEQLRQMTPVIEEAADRKMDPERLTEAVRKSRQTLRNYRDYLNLRPAVHFPEALTPELELDFCNHLLLGSDAAITFTNRLLKDVKEAPAITTQKKILWMHVLPNWQNSMCQIFQGADNTKVEVIGSDLAYSALSAEESPGTSELSPDQADKSENNAVEQAQRQKVIDADGRTTEKIKSGSAESAGKISMDKAFCGTDETHSIRDGEEDPYLYMARRLVYDSFNGPGSRRIDATLQLAREMKADGILIFCQWGCKQTQGISMAAKRVFEAAGFPTLILDGDGCDRTNGGSEQIVTRANAFVEQLNADLHM